MAEDSVQLQKDEIRNKIWNRLVKEDVARFPLPPHGRIPNYMGVEICSKMLIDVQVWKDANILKCNPDSPQKPVREAALAQGKTIYMAVPRLREERCFIELNKNRILGPPARGATIKGAFKYGKKVGPEHMKKVDLVIAGSVAINAQGDRVGKGGGFSDLEFALAREFDLVGEDTPVVTTVHTLQVIDEEIPMTPHDVPLDILVTPEGVTRALKRPKPKGILWEDLSQEKIKEIPILMKLAEEKQKGN